MVSKLKDKAKRRKGRGFTGGRGEDRDEVKFELHMVVKYFQLNVCSNITTMDDLMGKMGENYIGVPKNYAPPILITIFLSLNA